MKKLILLRHALAQDRAAALAHNIRDAQRPLTTSGREKMHCAAQGLRRLLPQLDLVLTSPWRRALQTAEILIQEYRRPLELKKCDALIPGAELKALLDVLHEYPNATTVLCVGHEPDLSNLAGKLITNRNKNLLNLKKGGACLLEFPRDFHVGDACLVWLLTPRMLRSLKKP